MLGARTRILSVLQAGLVAAALIAAQPSQAQDAGAETYDFAIEVQPLAEALVDFSRTTRRQVAADADAIRGVDSSAVHGRMTPLAALGQMVADTGLELVTVNGQNFALRPGGTNSAPTPRSAGADRTLDEIVVKGELLNRSLQDTHTSVSVLKGEDLERAINRDLYDVIERVAGVNMEPGGFGFVIRGIKTQGQNTSGGNAISYKIDGVTVNDFQAIRQGPASVWDLEQVEVLRGPQSTQQGQNALAGAIVMRSKDPVVSRFETKFRLDYGSFNERRYAAALNVPLGDHWAFRVSGEDYSNDGDIQHYITGEELGDGAMETYRAKLRYNNAENFDAILSYSYTDNFLASQAIRADEWPERRVNTNRQSRWAETGALSLLLRYDLNEQWSLESETARVETDWFSEQIGEPFNPDAFAQRTFIGGRFSEGVTEEFKVIYDGDAFRWVGGLYFADNEADATSSQSVDIPPSLTETLESTNRAVFTELEYDFNTRWTAILGLRYDNEERDFRTTTTGNDQSTNEFLPKAGIVYSIDDTRSVGFTLQRAYRAGGAFLDFGDQTVQTFEPEFTTNYELSYRSLNLDGRLKFNANAFYTEYTDMQLFSFVFDFVTFTGNTRVDNVGEASLYGGEIETVYDVTDNLSVFLSAGYSNTEIKEDVQSVGAVPGDSNQGNEFPLAPAWTGSLGGQYFFFDNWSVELTGSFTDKFYYNERNLPDDLNPSYFLVDGQISYQRDNWSVAIYGRNLLDREFLTRTRSDGFSSAGDPRFVGISLNASFQ